MNLRALQRNTPFLATAAVCVLLYLIASVRYTGFASPGVFINFSASGNPLASSLPLTVRVPTYSVRFEVNRQTFGLRRSISIVI